jgi:hypothetical protein
LFAAWSVLNTQNHSAAISVLLYILNSLNNFTSEDKLEFEKFLNTMFIGFFESMDDFKTQLELSLGLSYVAKLGKKVESENDLDDDDLEEVKNALKYLEPLEGDSGYLGQAYKELKDALEEEEII